MKNHQNLESTTRRSMVLTAGMALGGAMLTLTSGPALALSGAGAGAGVGAGIRMPQDGRSHIDPSVCQMIFIDLQASLVAGSTTSEPAAIALASKAMAEVAAILKIPTLFSVVLEGGKEPVLLDSLKSFSKPQNTLLRKVAGALTDPATLSALAKNKRKKLIIGGFVAEVAVLQAVLDAIKNGYEVYYLVDCIGSFSARTEAAAFRAIEQAGAIPTSVVSLMTRLAPDFYNSPGKEAFAAIVPLLK
jgi:nicotinamidase-related amidase